MISCKWCKYLYKKCLALASDFLGNMKDYKKPFTDKSVTFEM